MASQAKIMGSVTAAVRFITEQLQVTIAERRVELELTEDQVRKVNGLIEASIQNSYNRVMNNIMNSIES